MGNVFMRKTEDVFLLQKKFVKKSFLKKNVDFSSCRFSWRDY